MLMMESSEVILYIDDVLKYTGEEEEEHTDDSDGHSDVADAWGDLGACDSWWALAQFLAHHGTVCVCVWRGGLFIYLLL